MATRANEALTSRLRLTALKLFARWLAAEEGFDLRASLASDTSWRNTIDRTARSQTGRDARVGGSNGCLADRDQTALVTPT
jgi:hypothetical protein